MTTVPFSGGDRWRLYHGDCVDVIGQLPAESVGLSVFSPPFSTLYLYSDSIADMGNCADDAEFMAHFGFLISPLWHVTMPGRLAVIHCKDLPRFMNAGGVAGLRDFPGMLVRAFEECRPTDDPDDRWVFHSRVTIWKDPVVEMRRTNNLGLLYKSIRERSETTRQGMADYLVVLRKWTAGMDTSASPEPVTHERSDLTLDMWQQWASPIWMDINQTDVLNCEQARDDDDEKHICPLQLDVIERCVRLWSNPGDVVLSPFAGIGSEGVVSLRHRRRFIGVELKDSYHATATRFLEHAAREGVQASLFADGATA